MIKNVQPRVIACYGTCRLHSRSLFTSSACRSQNTYSKNEIATRYETPQNENVEKPKAPKKTLAQVDEEMRAAMEGRSGDGGLAGAELEGGKAVSMKRGVRDNMFRYI